MSRLLTALHSGRVLLMDGAMGTELHRAGAHLGECWELWNLTHPEKVQAIHRSYLDAGAECLLTHTFQANPVVLAKHHLESRLEAIHEAALQNARSAGKPDTLVLLDVGPVPDELRDDASQTRAWLQRVLASSSGADGLLLETYSGWMIPATVPFLKASCDMPILLSLTYKRARDGTLSTHDRCTPERLAEEAERSGLAALGVNCGLDIGMDEVSDIVRHYRGATNMPLFARPNAGSPTVAGEQWTFPRTPETMGYGLTRLLETGVAMVGGCCGTTPEHIAVFRALIGLFTSR